MGILWFFKSCNFLNGNINLAKIKFLFQFMLKRLNARKQRKKDTDYQWMCTIVGTAIDTFLNQLIMLLKSSQTITSQNILSTRWYSTFSECTRCNWTGNTWKWLLIWLLPQEKNCFLCSFQKFIRLTNKVSQILEDEIFPRVCN